MITIKNIAIAYKTYPLKKAFTISSGTIKEVPQMFIAIECAMGKKKIIGLGHNAYGLIWADRRNISLEKKDEQLKTVVKSISNKLIGFTFSTPFDFYRKFVLNNSSILPHLAYVMALSPIDLALWDAYGKSKQKFIFDLPLVKKYLDFTSFRQKKIMHLVGIDDSLASIRQAIRKENISAFKVKLRGNLSWDAKRMNSISTIAGVRELTADANEAYSAIEELNAFHSRLIGKSVRMLKLLEQPFPRKSYISLKKIRFQTPIFADESYAVHTDITRLKKFGYAGASLKPHTKTFSGTLLTLRELKKRKMSYAVMDLTTAPPIGYFVGIFTALHLKTACSLELNGRQYYKNWKKFLRAEAKSLHRAFTLKQGTIMPLPSSLSGWGALKNEFNEYKSQFSA